MASEGAQQLLGEPPSLEASAMTSSAMSVAKVFCEMAEWQLTNLEIQKLLYLAQMIHLGEHGLKSPLFRNAIEAWDLGPVVPAVYHKIKMFGSERVGNVFRATPNIEDDEDSQSIKMTYDVTRGKSASQLVAITHWEKGAWSKNYRPKMRGVVIPNEDILSEYNDRFEN